MKIYDEHGDGRPVLLLHGGAGPQSVTGFAQLLAAHAGVRVITPTHPGFAGTPRPPHLDGIPALAGHYAELLDDLALTDVVLVGNSIGGWVAAELALRDSSRIGGLIIVDGVGIEVPGEPVADIFPLALAQLADLSYHRPDAFRIDETTFDDTRRAGLAANRAALKAYAGRMTDPTLRSRLAALTVPTAVIWGESDRVATPAYGRAYAAAISGASFTLLPETGHVPQIESPEALLKAIHAVLVG
ncbi:alpha/beta fold hydrolase [Micromonosporaceae bacterium Da 78-11]